MVKPHRDTARHAQRFDPPDELARAAGRQAWARSAVAEAVSLLRRGLALVPALPDGDRRREVEFEMLIALGQALAAHKGWGVPELGAAYARARGLAVTLKRPRELLPSAASGPIIQ